MLSFPKSEFTPHPAGQHQEAILGRPLTPQDFPEDYDPEDEFLNRKIGYVVKHSAGKEPNTVSAGIETLWPIGNAPVQSEPSKASAPKDDDLPF